MKIKRLLFMVLMFTIIVGSSSFSITLTLEDVVKNAIANNYLIKAAEENIKAARYRYLSSTSAMFPKIDFSYTYTHLKYTPYMVSMGMRLKAGDKNNVKWFLRLTQPIFTGFALSTQRELAKLGVDLSDIYKREAVLDVALDAKVAYFNVLLAKNRLDVCKEAVRQLRSHLYDAEAFYKEHMVPLDDLLKSKVALANAIQNEVKAKNSLKVAKSSLAVVLGRDINWKFSLKDVSSDVSFKLLPLTCLYKRALVHRPAIRALKVQIAQEDLGAKLAASSYYPHIVIFTEYQQEGNNIPASVNNFRNQHNAMIGVQINWKIFDSFQTHYNIEEAKHKSFMLQEKLNQLLLKVKLSVEEAYLGVKTALQNLKTAKVALKEARENFRITTIRYMNQMATSTDVLDARTYLTQAEMNYYNALYGYYISLAKLKRAIGEY